MNKILSLFGKKHLLLLLSTVFVVYFLYLVKSVLLPFILGFFIAYLFKNIVKKYENKISRHWLSLIIVCLFSIFMFLIAIFVFPALISQLISMLRELITKTENIDFNSLYLRINKMASALQLGDIKDLQQYFLSTSNIFVKHLANITNGLLSSSIQILYTVSMICISPIVAFYFLRDWDKIFTFIAEHFIPDDYKKNYIKLGTRIDDILHHYITGQINVSLILGSYYSLALFFIHFNYAFIVGISAGLLTLLPYVGAFGGAFISLLLGYLQFGLSLSKLITIGIIFAFGQFMEGNFITPNLIGNKIQVHPLWLFFGIFAGGALYGFWGIVASMPIAGILGVLVRFYFEEKIKKDKYDISNR